MLPRPVQYRRRDKTQNNEIAENFNATLIAFGQDGGRVVGILERNNGKITVHQLRYLTFTDV